MSQAPGLQCHVQLHREQAGLAANELARRVGITRQGLHNIEKGQTTPNTLLTFRLARALGCRVEDLFTLTSATLTAELVGEYQLGARVQLAKNGLHWLAFPLCGKDGLKQRADGVLLSENSKTVEVELLGATELAERTAILAGCDPSLELLAAHTARQFPDVRVIFLTASSSLALQMLAAGQAHLAGIHLWDARTGESNIPFVERQGLSATRVISLWRWEQGLITAPGNPKGVQGVSDLFTKQLTLVNRDPGSGSRLLLDAWLDAAQISAEARFQLPGYAHEVATPMLAAQAVQAGAADLSPGPRVAAQALGLHFLPLQDELFDLILPELHLSHLAVQALLQTVKSTAFLRELALLGGYNTTHAGQLRRVVS